MLWMANLDFTSGRKSSGAALNVVAATTADDQALTTAYGHLAELSAERQPSTPEEKAAMAMLADENYRSGRVRQLPASLCGNGAVWLADVIAHKDMFPPGGMEEMPLLPCFFNESAKPPLIIPPFDFVMAAVKADPAVPQKWRQSQVPNPLPGSALAPPQLPGGSPPQARASGCSAMKIIALLVVLFLGWGGYSAWKEKSIPGNKEFTKASRAITTSQKGSSHGNTAAARAAAADFANFIKPMRESLFTAGKKGASLTDGEFVTWCQESPKGVAFLIHVPGLRQFTPDARESLGELCYLTGKKVVEKHFTPAPKAVAVAIRGVLIYDRFCPGPEPQGRKALTPKQAPAASRRFFPSLPNSQFSRRDGRRYAKGTLKTQTNRAFISAKKASPSPRYRRV